MSICLQVVPSEAQKAIVFLKENGLFDGNLKPAHAAGAVFFPLARRPSQAQAKKLKSLAPSAKTVQWKLERLHVRPRSLEEALERKLSPAERKALIGSFDTVGSLAVIEVPDALKKKAGLIGRALLEVNAALESVYQIASAHKGKFRVQKISWLAGKKQKRAHYKEAGCEFVVDLDKVFFSPRLSGERLRIAQLIQPGEVVGAFFAGVGPFPILFARHSPMAKAYAVELNPTAVKNLKENIRLNHVEDRVEPILGDVNKVVPKRLRGLCDRVVMPLPHGGEDFLEAAFLALKPAGGFIHFYQFTDKQNPLAEPLRRVEAVARKFGRSVEVRAWRVVRSFSPVKVQVVLDVEVRAKPNNLGKNK
ncbi:MAG: class I SAM-dependent methyltransferase family protein [Candidatus Diapherotrites archaeon]|uniref:Class I SAM-dependent methyltransferase family protein n=1 Tax=Candidatus Iainarchaeum sp. TaxID=3101447 RepID=A0A8T4L9J2_9ARCH|nr:class I SAM-dependent methyltransferase family protein [Candidatus Diapherotrites archaeon]